MLIGTRRALLGGRRVATYADKVLGYSPIAYWPLWEAEGSVAECLVNSAQNGTYVGVTLDQPGIGDDRTCPRFDGLNDLVNLYSPTLLTLFDSGGLGDEGTVIAWWKVYDANVWEDASWGVIFHVAEGPTANRILMAKSSTNNLFNWRYYGGSTVRTRDKTGLTTLDWVCTAMTWSKTGGAAIPYWNGVQEGATWSPGTWANSVRSDRMALGSFGSSAADLFNGYIAHCAIFDRPLAPAAALDLATV